MEEHSMHLQNKVVSPSPAMQSSPSVEANSQARNLEYEKLPSLGTSALSVKEKSVKKEVKEYQIQEIQSPEKEGISMKNVQVLEYASPPRKKMFEPESAGAKIGSQGDAGQNVTILTHYSKSNTKDFISRNNTHDQIIDQNRIDTEKETFDKIGKVSPRDNLAFQQQLIYPVKGNFSAQPYTQKQLEKKKVKSQIKREKKLQEELDKILSDEYLAVMDSKQGAENQQQFVDFNQLAVITESNFESLASMSQILSLDQPDHLHQYQQYQQQQFFQDPYLQYSANQHYGGQPYYQQQNGYYPQHTVQSIPSQYLQDSSRMKQNTLLVENHEIQRLKNSFQIGENYLAEEKRYFEELKKSSDRSNKKRPLRHIENLSGSKQNRNPQITLQQISSAPPQMYQDSNQNISNLRINHSGSTNDNGKAINSTEAKQLNVEEIQLSPLELAKALDSDKLKLDTAQAAKEKELNLSGSDQSKPQLKGSGIQHSDSKPGAKCQPSCCSIF